MSMEQRSLERDVETLLILKDYARIFQQRAHKASAAAHTTTAIDAIADLSNQFHDILQDFECAFERLVHEANREDGRIEARHQRSLAAE